MTQEAEFSLESVVVATTCTSIFGLSERHCHCTDVGNAHMILNAALVMKDARFGGFELHTIGIP